jgi:tungstate transport system ATP-binding protein
MHAPKNELPIRFDALSIRAGAVTILDGVDLTIAAGAPTVIVGPNGSGKTTLLRAAMGLRAAAQYERAPNYHVAGHITYGGIAGVPPVHRAIVFQRPAMLRRSAAGNIRYALRAAGRPHDHDASRIAELLTLVGLGGFADRPARRMSGGEQQRLALARALARDPAVLFLDEPTASLDPAATKAIEDVIQTIAARGIKIVMSTHDLGEARRLAGDIVLLHRGRVIESADSETFFRSPATSEARAFLAGELLI